MLRAQPNAVKIEPCSCAKPYFPLKLASSHSRVVWQRVKGMRAALSRNNLQIIATVDRQLCLVDNSYQTPTTPAPLSALLSMAIAQPPQPMVEALWK